MSKANDGGPAFPRPHSNDHCEYQANQEWAQQGMSVRTWLAGMALPSMIASIETRRRAGMPEVRLLDLSLSSDRNAITDGCVLLADAMLKALDPA